MSSGTSSSFCSLPLLADLQSLTKPGAMYLFFHYYGEHKKEETEKKVRRVFFFFRSCCCWRKRASKS